MPNDVQTADTGAIVVVYVFVYVETEVLIQMTLDRELWRYGVNAPHLVLGVGPNRPRLPVGVYAVSSPQPVSVKHPPGAVTVLARAGKDPWPPPPPPGGATAAQVPEFPKNWRDELLLFRAPSTGNPQWVAVTCEVI